MPVLKVKKNGVWEEVTGGFVPDNLVYTSEENQESATVPLNADTLGGNLPAYYATQEQSDSLQTGVDDLQMDVTKLQTGITDLETKYDSSCYYAHYRLNGDYNIAAASTYEDLPLRRVNGYGDFCTLSDDGLTITFNKQVMVALSAQIYYYTSGAAGASGYVEIYCSNASNGHLVRSQMVLYDDTPYQTVATPMVVRKMSVGDTIKLQAYSSRAGVLIKDYFFSSSLFIDVKGIVE